MTRAKAKAEGDLFAAPAEAAPVPGERCVKVPPPHVKAMFDPREGDSAQVLRNKWKFRLMAFYYTPCMTGGPECPRCKAKYSAQWNKPEWPWVP